MKPEVALRWLILLDLFALVEVQFEAGLGRWNACASDAEGGGKAAAIAQRQQRPMVFEHI